MPTATKTRPAPDVEQTQAASEEETRRIIDAALDKAAHSEKTSSMKNGCGHRLTPEQKLAIGPLYVALGSKAEVARALGCSDPTVAYWLKSLSGEEWDRIQEEQRQELLVRAVDILYQALDLAPGKLKDASMRDILGTVKIIRDAIAAWGGVGAEGKSGVVGEEDEVDKILAEAESRRRQRAIEEALASGSLEPLRELMGRKEEVPA